jgi:hypothetical protein
MKVYDSVGRTRLVLVLSALVFCVTCSCNDPEPAPGPGMACLTSLKLPPKESPLPPGLLMKLLVWRRVIA